ncbi:MAG: ATP-binding protein [Undibacterium sp.]|uniref:sensor histidine kinase n=1 Tax=Undibacterium sp. TaxID=1914977 RepID=UPI002728BD9F|nr:ATP-binding protein [Undibacterium sp.]MDO8651896.1 ATP-binding protein [Undibacterium sp.]
MSESSPSSAAALPTLPTLPLLQRWRASWSHRLYFRIYLAILASLTLAALLFGIVAHIHADPAQFNSSLETFADIAVDLLPPADAPHDLQQAALRRWHARARTDMAIYDANGAQIAAAGNGLPLHLPPIASSGWLPGYQGVFALKLPDQRWLLGQRAAMRHRTTLGLIGALTLIALAIALGSYPIVRRLTLRLERLQTSVDALGAGQLSTRVAVEGNDEVARLAISFNHSAARIEALMAAQKSLLANASHELRSPLARIRMAAELLQTQAPPAIRAELARNINELDQLIDEILLSSRLDAASDSVPSLPMLEEVDLIGLLAEECARVNAQLSLAPDQPAAAAVLQGEPKLLRRMLRNLLENARRHGGGSIDASLTLSAQAIELNICDRGAGVPPEQRELIFAPFYRLTGASENDGGVGLGLSLVRQIAHKHGGTVECLAREGGGSCFRVRLPLTRAG